MGLDIGINEYAQPTVYKLIGHISCFLRLVVDRALVGS